MAIYDFFLSRNNGPTLQNYIGHAGRLFYDSTTGEIRISDGTTPGGHAIPVTIATTGIPGSVKPGLGLTVDADGIISIDAVSSFAFAGNKLSLLAATSTRLGGVKLGPGVITNGEGQIIIDSTGLDFSFGDFSALTGTYPANYFETARQNQEYAILSSVTTNEDIVLASNGTGAVRVVGDFSVRRSDGSIAGALLEQPIFRVNGDGQVRMLVPAADTTEGAVNIVGGLDGVFQPPINTGVMLHITGIASDSGQPVPSRVYNDSQGAFAAFVARRYNGFAAAPTAVLDGEEIMRLSGTAHNGTTIPSTGNQRIVYKALGNQTLTNQGGSIEFWATPINTTTLGKIATVSSTGITLETGKVLTGNVTGNLTGTADIATTVALVATNTTDATHYLTFVDSATGNENVRTDTGLTYNPGTNTLTAGVGAFTTFTGKYIRNVRAAGTIAAGGTLTINFATDAVVYCVWGDGMTLAYQNYTAGSIVRVIARKAAGTGVDTFSLGGLTAANTSIGSTTSGNVSADTTSFIELSCTGTTIGSVYAKL